MSKPTMNAITAVVLNDGTTFSDISGARVLFLQDVPGLEQDEQVEDLYERGSGIEIQELLDFWNEHSDLRK
jgi:hypothetical protein